MQVLDVSKEGKEEVFYGPTLPFASNGIAACFLPAPYFTCPNLQTLQVPHHRIGTMWHIPCASQHQKWRGKTSNPGFIWVSEKNQSAWAAALPSHICLKVGSQQAGRELQSLRAVSLLSLRRRSRYVRALCISAGHWLLATCLLHFLMQLCQVLWTLWALPAALWSLHIPLFTSGAFKDNKKALFVLTKMI